MSINFTEDFAAFTGTGFSSAAAAGQLSSDIWRITGLSDGDGAFGGEHVTGDFARGSDEDGGVGTGGVYAFSTGGDPFLGIQPGGSDFTPGEVTLQLTNTSGAAVGEVEIAYDILANNNTERANALNFAYSLDDVTYVPVPSLDFTTPEVSDALGFQSTSRSATIAGISIPDGGALFLQWQGDDVSGSGTRDEYGIDNIAVTTGATPVEQNVWINEFHYDNDGGDEGEFIEVAFDGESIAGYSLVLYNGNGGAPYATIPLTGTGTLGSVNFEVVTPTSIQNGAPDGIALVDATGDVLEFISYEGSFTAVGGAADGLTSTDIGVTEPGDTPVGFSLQLGGTGSVGADFAWQSPLAETPGALNTNQIVGTAAPQLTIAATDANLAEGDAGTTDFIFTVTRGGDTSVAVTADYAVAGGSADAADFGGTLPSGTVSFAAGDTEQVITVPVSGDTDAENDETFDVVLSNATGGAVIATDTATGTIVNDDGVAVTLISEIQGIGSATPLDGQTVTIEAIVVADYQDGVGENGDLNGFYVQEEDTDADGDPLTSEGLFIFDGSAPAVDVSKGDLVRITGTAGEFFDQTQLSGVTVEVVSSGNDLPSAASVSFPVAAVDDLEAYEGMLVTIPDELFITEYFNYDRFGEMVVSVADPASDEPGSDGRLDQFTQFNAPDVAGFTAYQEAIATRRLVVDDGLTTQNPALILPDGTAFSNDNSFRGGDSFVNLTGVLGYGFGEYRVQPVADLFPNSLVENNPRPTEPDDVGGSLTVASFNVLNFFTTIDGEGTSGPSGLDPRGADSDEEFDRQLEKLVTAIDTLDADILGLVELENEFSDQNGDDLFAIDALVDALNQASGDTYAFADPGVDFVDTGDAISNGLIYRTEAVDLSFGTTVEILTDSDFSDLGLSFGAPVFDGESTNRASVAATFTEIATGGEFTVAVNHFKSKGGTGEGDNADIGDGQGNFNGTRTDGAEALAVWLDSDPTGSGDSDYLIIGDLNAYAQEDPVTTLEAEGYQNVFDILGAGPQYSFVFDGQFGSLDYALASESLADQVTGATDWHVNADEADALDYNLDFDRDPTLFNGDDPFRNSDHDPLLVGLDLTAPVSETELLVQLINADTDTVIRTIEEGDTVLLSEIGSSNVTLSAIVPADSPFFGLEESMKLDFNDGQVTRTENVEPYALFGDASSDFAGQDGFIPLGENLIAFDIFSANGGNGALLGEVDVNFTVVDDLSVDPVVAADDSAGVTESEGPGDPEENVLDNDVSGTGDPIAVVAVEGSSANVDEFVDLQGGGRLRITDNGLADFDADGDFEFLSVGESTTVSADVTVGYQDGSGTSSSTFVITVSGENDTPVAVDDTFESQGSATVLDILSNDSDPDGDDLEVLSFTQPAGGEVIGDVGGGLIFVPNGGELTEETSFEYTISDGFGGTDSATVTLTTEPVVSELEVLVSADGEARGAGNIDATQGGRDNDLEIGGGDITGLLFDDVEIAFGSTVAQATLVTTSQRGQGGSRDVEIGLSAETEGQVLTGPINDHFDFTTTETVAGFIANDAEVAFDVTGIVNDAVDAAGNTDGTYDLNFALQTDGAIFRINAEEFGEDVAARLLLEFA